MGASVSKSSGVKFLEQKEVPIGDLKPHEQNPNRGDINAIAESLEQFGQYRSVVALKDMTILAGHHVVQAAKNLGIKTVRVDIVECDDKTARKLMLADNRLADLGLGPDLDMLLKNLEELAGDLEGTGFDTEYLRLLEEAVIGPTETEVSETDGAGEAASCKRISLLLDSRLAAHWEAHRKLFPDDTSAFGYLLS
jgi:ParB-like chromosome segregation protein Spo0J